MSNFNERTALNYRLRQDALTMAGRRQMAHQRIAYRHRRATLRSMIRTVAIDAALIGSILTACVVLLVCAVG